MGGPSNTDMAKDAGWNFLTGIPGVGTVAAGLSAVNDVRHMISADNKEEEQQAFRDLAGDMISATPAVGTLSSFGGIVYDIASWGDDTSGNLMNQLMGGKDAYPGYSEEGGNYTPAPTPAPEPATGYPAPAPGINVPSGPAPQ